MELDLKLLLCKWLSLGIKSYENEIDLQWFWGDSCARCRYIIGQNDHFLVLWLVLVEQVFDINIINNSFVFFPVKVAVLFKIK